MAGRSGRRRVDPSSPLVDLDLVFADDKLVDAIAAQPWGATEWSQYNSGAHGRAHTGSARGALLTVDPLTELLESWREELAVSPMPAPPDARRAPVRLQQRRSSRGRRLRPAMAIAAAIAALLVGSASVGSKEASRDSLLWALTEVLWPSRAESVASADRVQAALVEARFALDDGRSQDAQLALLRATVALGGVEGVDGRDGMQQTVAELWVRAAPQGLPAGTQPSEFVGRALPPVAQPHRPAESTAAVAPVSAGTAGAGQLAALQGVPAPIAQSPAPLAGTSQTTPGAGSSSASAQPSTNSSAGSTAIPVDTQAAVPASGDPTTAGPTGTASGTPTPAPSTAPVTSTAEASAAQPPSAPAQSAPSPTPSEPAYQLDASTDSQSAAGSAGDSNAAASSSATGDSVADAPADQQAPIQSIPLDPAAVGSG